MTTKHTRAELVQQRFNLRRDNENLRTVNAELLAALEVSRATIKRLEVKQGPFSSVQGTLDVVDAAITNATKGD